MQYFFGWVTTSRSNEASIRAPITSVRVGDALPLDHHFAKEK
jgi:hypothetical protein